MGEQATAELAIEAVELGYGVAASPTRVGLSIIRITACQFTALAFGSRLQALGMRPSMGTVGDSLDNALIESFFASLECELIDRRHWRTRAEAHLEVFWWLEAWYNRARRHSALDYLSPVEYEARRFAPATSPSK